MVLSSLVLAGQMPHWMLGVALLQPLLPLNSVLEFNSFGGKSRSSALQAPLPMTETEPLLSLEASVHVHACCSVSAYTLLLPEEGTVCMAGGSWKTSMSYFGAAWSVPLILSGAS